MDKIFPSSRSTRRTSFIRTSLMKILIISIEHILLHSTQMCRRPAPWADVPRKRIERKTVPWTC